MEKVEEEGHTSDSLPYSQAADLQPRTQTCSGGCCNARQRVKKQEGSCDKVRCNVYCINVMLIVMSNEFVLCVLQKSYMVHNFITTVDILFIFFHITLRVFLS